MALWSRELMAPLIKCLPHKQKDLSLNHMHPCKIMGTVCKISKFRTGGVETDRPQRLTGHPVRITH